MLLVIKPHHKKNIHLIYAHSFMLCQWLELGNFPDDKKITKANPVIENTNKPETKPPSHLMCNLFKNRRIL